MNAAHRHPPVASTRHPHDERALAKVRGQAAFVRALLDEVERVTAHGAPRALRGQLVEELARLGCEFLDLAAALTQDSEKVSRCA